MREPGLIMKAKQLAPSIESGAVKFERCRLAICNLTDFLVRPER
jgi:hypothetical protein